MSKQPWLCAAGKQLRDQIDTWYPDRRSTSDGWIGDARHSATKSDHNPDKSGCVRAVDVDSRLDSSEGISIYLADQIRKCAKTDKRISYVIHNGMIASRILNFKWRKYKVSFLTFLASNELGLDPVVSVVVAALAGPAARALDKSDRAYGVGADEA
jgi:hypothetical protein